MKKNTTKQPKLAEDSIIANLKAKFGVGEVPKAEDFGDLIELSAQVRAVDSSGLDLNDVTGELSVNYGTVSETLAGSVADTGLTGTGNTLVVDYGTVSTKLAGTAADTGLTGTGNTLVVDYGTVSTKLAGTGLTGAGNTLVVDYHKVWMKMMAKVHCATHYFESDDIVVFFHSIDGSAHKCTRAFFYTMTSTFAGVYHSYVWINGVITSRYEVRKFQDTTAQEFDATISAEWPEPLIEGSIVEVWLRCQDWKGRYTGPIQSISELDD